MKTIELHEKAVKLGFSELMEADEFLALCKIQKWLMDEYKIYVCIGPWQDRFSSFVVFDKRAGYNYGHSSSFGKFATWVDAFEGAIEEALSVILEKNN